MTTAAIRTFLIAAVSWTIVAAATPAAAQPTITSSITPLPNRFGWNNTPVTLSFECARAVLCPEPMAVTNEGDRQLFRQTVTDESGRTATVSTEISIDFTPVEISITAPSSESTAAVTVLAARFSDARSGVDSATCNGDPVAVQSSDVSCIIPLRDGVNDLIVQVIDRAGNSSSTGVQVHRVGRASSITVVPSEVTLLTRQPLLPQVVDNFGRTLLDVEWSIADSSVVAAGVDPRTLTAASAGTTTVTARWRTLTSSIKVNVVAGTRLPDWATRWHLRPLAGYRSDAEIINLTRGGADAPSMIEIEREIAGPRLILRALDEAPRQLWIESPAISARERIGEQLAGDDMGAGLLRVESADGRSSSIVRVGRPQYGTLWRYTPAGRLGEKFAEYDGIVDVVETPPDGFPVLVGIDASTGAAKFRIPLARSSFTALNAACIEGANARHDRPADVGVTPTVLDNGVVNLAVSTTATVEDALPCGKGTVRTQRTVQLLQVRDGRVTYRPVYEYPSSPGNRVDVVLSPVLPDGHGGQLVAWSARVGRQPVDHTIVRTIGEQLIPFHLPALGPMIIAEHDMGVTTDGHTIVGFDVTNGQILWTHRATQNGTFRILTAEAGGGLTVETERGLERFDRAGRRVLLGRNSP